MPAAVIENPVAEGRIGLTDARARRRFGDSASAAAAYVDAGYPATALAIELALAADRSYMLDGQFEGDNRPPAVVRLSAMNFGPYPMVNGLTRLASRFLDDDDRLAALEARIGEDLDALAAEEAGLVTFAPDDIDWEDEVRLAIEERHGLHASVAEDGQVAVICASRRPRIGPRIVRSREARETRSGCESS